MTRNEAKLRLIEYALTIQEAEQLITLAENDQCEPTSRLLPYWDTTVEFKGSATFNGRTGVDVFYYPEESEIEAAYDDLGNINWRIEKYEVW